MMTDFSESKGFDCASGAREKTQIRRTELRAEYGGEKDSLTILESACGVLVSIDGGSTFTMSNSGLFPSFTAGSEAGPCGLRFAQHGCSLQGVTGSLDSKKSTGCVSGRAAGQHACWEC